MTKAQRIEEYIKDCFEVFHLNYKEYYYYEFEEGNPEEILWADDKGKISISAVEHASEVLGISVENILACNDDARRKWLRKYPFFWCMPGYEYSYEKSFYAPGFENLRLIERIFDSDLHEQYPVRFDYDDVVKRMIEKLKLQDRVEPGSFHEGASIQQLQITTENFCSFDRIEEMTISFIEMIKTATRLFLKALREELCAEEVEEYNLLVSVLGLRDRYYTRGYLYYNQLLKVKEFYCDLNEETFSSVIVFKRALNFKPWRYSEFICNKDLVQDYLNVMPQAKAIMREYAMEVSRFRCVFIWSDAKPITFSPEEEKMLSDFNEVIGEEDIPVEQRAKERSFVNIDKTSEELNGEEKTAEKIIGYCRPVKLGGLAVRMPQPDNDPLAMIKHINTLLGKVEHNNYIERIIARSNSSGGASDE